MSGLSGAAPPTLEARSYSLSYATSNVLFEALKSVDIAVTKGRTLGLVGESGSGKTSLAWAIMRYLPVNAREGAGSLFLSGEDLRAKSRAEIAALRGSRISMVFQDPSTSLNPTLTLGEQIAEVLMRHRELRRRDALAEGEALLARTGITRPAEMMTRYPHQASGGEKQRVVIATAFACNPECIIFDEPTTALDVITARQILELFVRLQEDTGVAALYISHDLALVSRVAHDVAVIHRGEIVERGPTAQIFAQPRRGDERADRRAVGAGAAAGRVRATLSTSALRRRKAARRDRAGLRRRAAPGDLRRDHLVPRCLRAGLGSSAARRSADPYRGCLPVHHA
jgi:peptide/nickel transport system ATP-binding protein